MFFESLERRLLLTVLPSGFAETRIAQLGIAITSAEAIAPDGRIFICDTHAGDVRVLKGSTLLSTPFLHVSVSSTTERGLENIAFDPNFSSNRFVYVYYTHAGTTPKNRLSRFRANSSNPDVIDGTFGINGEQVLLDNIDSTHGNHNGGALAFGTDGMLYVGVGEAGVGSNAQNLGTVSGKILRLNVRNFDGTAASLVPSDNPFVNTSGARKEIFAYGMRNPFSGAIKPGTNTLFINDVGQNTWEEIDDVRAGKNYGWPSAEGNSTNSAFTNPVYVYNHDGGGAAITGGTFYAGAQFPSSYGGKYFFADYIKRFIRVLDPTTRTATNFATSAPSIVDLDVAADGSLIALSLDGSVYRYTFGKIRAASAADAYVRDGADADRNFGQATSLAVKLGGSGFNRQSFLRFDISSLGTIGSAKLRLFGGLNASGSIPISIYKVGSTTWSENSITWNARPSSSSTASASTNVNSTSKRYWEWDLTTLVKTEQSAGRSLLSIAMRATSTSSPFASFNSDESLPYKPQLLVTPGSSALPAASPSDNSSSGVGVLGDHLQDLI